MPAKGETVEGTFNPSDLSKVHPNLHDLVGEKCEWTYGWIIRHFDPTIDGTWAMIPASDSPFPFKWTAQEDVDITEGTNSGD